MTALPAILANGFVVAAALGFGSLLRRLFPENFSKIDRLAMSLLGGLGLLGTILFCVGQIRFSRSTIVAILLFGVLLGVRTFVRSLQKYRAAFSPISIPVLPAMVILSVFLVTAIGGLAEPTGDMNNDAIAYHYFGPKVWLRDSVIHPVADEVLTYFPVAVETQYAALISLGGQRAPGFFAVIGLLSILLMAASLANRMGLDLRGIWWVAALLVTMPVLYRGAYGGFIDVFFSGFILAAARIAFDAHKLRHYVLIGVFCGISMGTKYTGIITSVLLLLCSFLISVCVQRHNYRSILKYLAISCGVAAAFASPFYLRNWILFGCPIYPPPGVLLRIFTVKNILPSVVQALQQNVLNHGHGMGRGLGRFLLLPFNLTFHTANFNGAGGIGLAPLALGPFGLVVCRKNTFAKGLALFALLQMVAWFVIAQESRYVIHIYAIAVIFAVLGWQYVQRASRYAQAISVLIVASSIFYGLFMIVSDRVEDLHAAVSRSFETTRRCREIPFIESFNYLNTEPFVSKVLILNPYVAAFYLDKPYVKPIGRWGEQSLPNVTHPSQALSQLHSLHISHVLDAPWVAGSFEVPENTQGLTLVFERRDQRIYRVN
ncbi:MAG: ArnT family glycosyltransferase [Candidatus Acidiferrales bacterium]